MKKLKEVSVSWKYSTDNGNNTFDVRFPNCIFSGDELIGKTRWSDEKWVIFAMESFEKIKGFKTEQRDLIVYRNYFV